MGSFPDPNRFNPNTFTSRHNTKNGFLVGPLDTQTQACLTTRAFTLRGREIDHGTEGIHRPTLLCIPHGAATSMWIKSNTSIQTNVDVVGPTLARWANGSLRSCSVKKLNKTDSVIRILRRSSSAANFFKFFDDQAFVLTETLIINAFQWAD